MSSLRVFHPTFTTGLFRESPPPKLSIRKLPQKYSTEMTFPPTKTIIPQRESLTNPPESDLKRKIGLKRVNIKFTEGKSRDERRHFTPRFGYEKIPEPPFQIKTFSPDGNYCTNNFIFISNNLFILTSIRPSSLYCIIPIIIFIYFIWNNINFFFYFIII